MEDEENVFEGDNRDEGETTFSFPILDQAPNFTMKIIPPLVFLNFKVMHTKDPISFLFDFDILCRGYNYINDSQKLKMFMATLKYSSIRWFMALRESTIRYLDKMKSIYIKKYQDYHMARDSHNDIFKMK